MPFRPHWSVLCDFDGTIGLLDTIDTLLHRFGQPGWETLEEDWLAGRMGSGECMRRQVALLDMDADEFADHLSTLDIDPAFPAFAAAVAARGWPLEIVSDGLDQPIRILLARSAVTMPPLASNALHQVSERRWSLTSPHAAPGCAAGTCKCARAERARRMHRGTRVLLVGDGGSDFCAAAHVDHVFAKHKLLAHCRRHGIAHTAIGGFSDALALLPSLHDGSLFPPASIPVKAAISPA